MSAGDVDAFLEMMQQAHEARGSNATAAEIMLLRSRLDDFVDGLLRVNLGFAVNVELSTPARKALEASR